MLIAWNSFNKRAHRAHAGIILKSRTLIEWQSERERVSERERESSQWEMRAAGIISLELSSFTACELCVRLCDIIRTLCRVSVAFSCNYISIDHRYITSCNTFLNEQFDMLVLSFRMYLGSVSWGWVQTVSIRFDLGIFGRFSLCALKNISIWSRQILTVIFSLGQGCFWFVYRRNYIELIIQLFEPVSNKNWKFWLIWFLSTQFGWGSMQQTHKHTAIRYRYYWKIG